MSLQLNKISLSSWRNFKDYQLELAPGLTVLVGPNAVGKTNTIEALQYVTSGTSFRKPTPSELVYEGERNASIKGDFEGDGRLITIEMKISDTSRKFFKNGKAILSQDISDTLPSILFNPDDLLLIKGSASHRRDELDNFGAQIHSSYRKIYNTYMRSIEQRNHLLKDGCSGVLLDSWDESVSVGAATLLQYRLRMFERLKLFIQDIYADIVKDEVLTCVYSSSLVNSEDSQNTFTQDVLLTLPKNELAHIIQQALYAHRAEDLRRGQTTLGPHRDDVNFLINGKDARKYGSQGQQRSIVLAWKMAEVKFYEQLSGNQPLLLLDDVMSELDEQRRTCITNFISSGIQTVITTTNLGYFNIEELKDVKVVEYERAI